MDRKELFIKLIRTLVALGAGAIFAANLHAQTKACPSGYEPSLTTRDSSGNQHIVGCVDPKTGGYWFAGKIADTGGQVYDVKPYGAVGDGIHDDTSAFNQAVAAMPPCTSNYSYDHCGTLYLPPGKYKLSGSLTLDSPYVKIVGASPFSTEIDYTGDSRCAIEWTAKPFNANEFASAAGGLYGLSIDGAKAGAGTCGLRTYDIVGMHISNVLIRRFNKSRSVGWLDQAVNNFCERYVVDSVQLADNTTGWKMEGKGPDSTFGYGTFHVWVNPHTSGQVGVWLDNHADFIFANLFLIENMANGTTGISLTKSSRIFQALLNAHMEGTSVVGLSVDQSSAVKAMGIFDELGSFEDRSKIEGIARITTVDGGTLRVYRNGWTAPLVEHGTVILSEGRAKVKFASPFQSTPTCTVSDQSSAKPVSPGTPTYSGLTITGSGSDTIAWSCVNPDE